MGFLMWYNMNKKLIWDFLAPTIFLTSSCDCLAAEPWKEMIELNRKVSITANIYSVSSLLLRHDY